MKKLRAAAAAGPVRDPVPIPAVETLRGVSTPLEPEESTGWIGTSKGWNNSSNSLLGSLRRLEERDVGVGAS